MYGCSLLGEAVPGLYNVDRDFHEFLNIIITLMTSDEAVIVRRAAAQGTARLIESMIMRMESMLLFQIYLST